MKVIVIGAGIVGSCAAYRLAEAGANVTVLDARRPGGGTSSVSYAWVNACEKLTSRSYFELNLAGVKAHAGLVEEFPGADWYPRPGIVQWQHAEPEAGGPDRDEVGDKLRRLQEWGYPAELLSHQDLRALEPDIAPDAVGNAPVIHYPQDGWVYPVLLVGTVLRAATERFGARVVSGARVSALIIEGGRCAGVTLADGTRHEADVVVNCGGRWANDVVQDEGLRIPLAPTYGIIAYTSPVGVSLRHGLRTPLVNMRPDGGGRFLLRSNELDRLLTSIDGAEPAHPQAQDLLRRAKATIPAMAGVEVEAVRIAIRPIPQDGYSALGPVPGLDDYYLAVTHSGVTLAPFIGVAVADEIVHGRQPAELADFRPSRFFS
jgi:glycine/D-amino acid oxidase-like deaminating enzyme